MYDYFDFRFNSTTNHGLLERLGLTEGSHWVWIVSVSLLRIKAKFNAQQTMTYELANSLQCQLRLQTRIEADSDSTQKHRIRNFPEGEFKWRSSCDKYVLFFANLKRLRQQKCFQSRYNFSTGGIFTLLRDFQLEKNVKPFLGVTWHIRKF